MLIVNTHSLSQANKKGTGNDDENGNSVWAVTRVHARKSTHRSRGFLFTSPVVGLISPVKSFRRVDLPIPQIDNSVGTCERRLCRNVASLTIDNKRTCSIGTNDADATVHIDTKVNFLKNDWILG